MGLNINFNTGGMNRNACQPSNTCVSKDGCPQNRCPDFTIRRHDTRPPIKISVSDCDGPLDLKGLVVEANMWIKARLKTAIQPETTYFALADGIGFEQIMVGDVIVMDHTRSPEYMIVYGFDEVNSFVLVERGYRGTTARSWKRGSHMRVFRMMNSPAQSEMVLEDIQNIDGTVTKDTLTDSFLVYEWNSEDTCLPGCFWLEFKLLKMLDLVLYLSGGDWIGPIHQDAKGVFYTGTIATDSSVQLSYDSVNNVYILPDTVWTGNFNLYSHGYYTGTSFDDGSVLLTTNNAKVGASTDFSSPIPSNIDFSSIIPSNISLTPPLAIPPSVAVSFSEQGANPQSFGCYLGEGVEWVRRFPVSGEGFLIKIVDSPTREL